MIVIRPFIAVKKYFGFPDWIVENTWCTLHAHFGLICGINRMNAPPKLYRSNACQLDVP